MLFLQTSKHIPPINPAIVKRIRYDGIKGTEKAKVKFDKD